MHNFWFGNNDLLKFCGRIAQAPSHRIAQRDFDLTEIPGRSGDVFLDNGRYKNVEFDIPIYFMPYLSKLTAKQLAYAVIDWLSTCIGYQEYQDSYNPGYYTKAVLLNFDEIKQELPSLLKTKLSFSRVPYWYRLDGRAPIEIPRDETPIQLFNYEAFSAEPIIKYLNEDSAIKASVVINDIKVPMATKDGCVERVMDGVAKQYIGYDTSGLKSYINSQLPPDLNSGINIITAKSNGGSFELIPNWRRL